MIEIGIYSLTVSDCMFYFYLEKEMYLLSLTKDNRILTISPNIIDSIDLNIFKKCVESKVYNRTKKQHEEAYILLQM